MSGPNSLKSLALLKPEDKISLTSSFNMDSEKHYVLNRFGIKERYAHFRKFYEFLPENKNSHERLLIDQGILIYFPEGKSFTGEDIIEFHIHGGKAIQTKFITELSKIPEFRMAEQV